MYDCKEASLLGPQGLTRGVCFRQERKAWDKRTAHPLKYLRLVVSIKKRIFFYCPDWGFSIKKWVLIWLFGMKDRMNRGWPWAQEASSGRDDHRKGRGDACFLELAGLACKERQWAALGEGLCQGETRGSLHTLSCSLDYVHQQMGEGVKQSRGSWWDKKAGSCGESLGHSHKWKAFPVFLQWLIILECPHCTSHWVKCLNCMISCIYLFLAPTPTNKLWYTHSILIPIFQLRKLRIVEIEKFTKR